MFFRYRGNSKFSIHNFFSVRGQSLMRKLLLQNRVEQVRECFLVKVKTILLLVIKQNKKWEIKWDLLYVS